MVLNGKKVVEIRLCSSYSQLPADKFAFSVLDINYEPPIPPVIEDKVEKTWEKFTAKNSKATDGQVAYLHSFQGYDSGNGPTAAVNLAPYRYARHFARDDIEMIDTKSGDYARLFPLTTWIIVSSNDNEGLFGYKHDYDVNVVSGFGSIVAAKDCGVNSSGATLDEHLQRVLGNELGERLAERLVSSELTTFGLNYSPQVSPLSGEGKIIGPREFDLVCHARIDGDTKKLVSLMQENEQFKKELIPVKLDEKNLFAFLKNKNFNHTKSCVGGIISYLVKDLDNPEKQKTVAEYNYFGRINLELIDPALNGQVNERVTLP